MIWHVVGMILVWFWHDFDIICGMSLTWLWDEIDMILTWCWHDFGMILTWFWHDSGMMLTWLWHDFGMIMACSITRGCTFGWCFSRKSIKSLKKGTWFDMMLAWSWHDFDMILWWFVAWFWHGSMLCFSQATQLTTTQEIRSALCDFRDLGLSDIS